MAEINNIEIQHLPQQEKRVETGVVKFGKDWNSAHFRGDDAFHFLQSLIVLLSRIDTLTKEQAIAFLQIKGYMHDLNRCNENVKMREEMGKIIKEL